MDQPSEHNASGSGNMGSKLWPKRLENHFRSELCFAIKKYQNNMKIHEIPSHLGITAAQLADLMKVSPQALNNYLRGRKVKESKFVNHLLDVANLSREEIIFPDRFEHPDGENPEHPAYWMNIAAEAIAEAVDRGLPEDVSWPAMKGLLAEAEKLLTDLPEPADDRYNAKIITKKQTIWK